MDNVHEDTRVVFQSSSHAPNLKDGQWKIMQQKRKLFRQEEQNSLPLLNCKNPSCNLLALTRVSKLQI